MIPILYIKRQPSTDEGTFGLAHMGDFLWYTLELPDRGNCTGISCIPAGDYLAVRKWSPHFDRDVFLLQGVPGRSDVEIHPASFAGDTAKGYQSDLRGCITIGLHRGSILNALGKMQQGVYQSRAANDQLLGAVPGTMQVCIRDAGT